MERRIGSRHAIYLNARISSPEGDTWPCIIADFCAEGMFIKYDPQFSLFIQEAIVASPSMVFQVAFKDSDTQKLHKVSVRPARVIEGAMGVSLVESNPEAIASMLKMCGVAAPVSAPSRPVSDQLAFILGQCRRALVDHLVPLLRSYFPQVDEALVQAADAAVTDQAGAELLKVATLLKNNQERLLSRVDGTIARFLSADEVRKQAPGNDAGSSLSLIEKNEFEDWLMFRVMITKAETLYRSPLLQLKMRLDKLGIAGQSGSQNPLGPALVMNAFRELLVPLNIAHSADKLIYRTFEAAVLKDLAELYEELNAIFIRHNVLPDLDLSKYVTANKAPEPIAKKAPDTARPAPQSREPAVDAGSPARTGGAASLSTPKPQPEKPAQASPPPGRPSTSAAPAAPAGRPAKPLARVRPSLSAEASLVDVSPPFARPRGVTKENYTEFRDHQRAAQHAYQSIRGLFDRLETDRQRTQSGKAKAPADSRPSLSGDELQKRLAVLQRQAAQSAEDYPARADLPLAERLQESGKEAGGANKKVPQEYETHLDVVDRFFASMAGSEKLTEQTKLQLRRLDVPLAKILIRDRHFFEQMDSPVRAVLNRIAMLGVKGGRPNPIHQKKVDELVTRINENFDQDTGIFEETLKELDELIERQNLVYRRNVQRVTEAAEGEQKVNAARERVAMEMEQRIAGKRVPRAIVTLINGGWQDLLALTCIRQGVDSQLWQDYLQVLDTLLGFAADPTRSIQLSELLRIIQDGLSTISDNQIPSALIRDELKRFLTAKTRQAMDMVDIPPPEPKAPLPEQAEDGKGKGLQRWITRVQKLQPGDWMRYEKAGEPPQYMRLVWIAKGHSRFAFVNHQGMKVVTLDQLKLARYLYKKIVVLDPDYETPVVDESLDNMVKKVYGQLSWIATHDALTGLVNRKEFERAVAQALAPEQEYNRWTVMHLDVRGFRLVNDSAGYDGGDHLLKTIAKMLQAQAPVGALVGRLHGNEFAMLIGEGDAPGLAEHLVELFYELRFNWKSVDYEVGLNVGIAESSKALSSAAKLLKAASDACREAKRYGNNRVQYPSLDEGIVFQQEQITAKVAGMGDINEERILLRCQKIIPLQPEARRGIQYEILLSIYDDRGHLIPAGEFVRTAERYNRMQAVDRWVVGYVLDWMGSHKKELDSMGGISINLSGHSLNDADLLEFMYDRLSVRDVPMEKLWFEITEAAAIANVADVAEFMHEMKEIGCHFCLGNFGAGMSSYHFLKELPVDMIKIDGSFVKDLATDENDRAMVRSMAEMVHFMGKEVIASQVEDKASLDVLKSLGVDYAQGYVIERPRLISSF